MAKPVATVPVSNLPQQLHPVRSKPVVIDSPPNESGDDPTEVMGPALVCLKEASMTRTRVKCKSVGEMVGPALKRSRMDQPVLGLGELDRLAGLMTSVWGEVTDAREAVWAAEGRLWTVEGRLHDIDDWVRDLHRHA